MKRETPFTAVGLVAALLLLSSAAPGALTAQEIGQPFGFTHAQADGNRFVEGQVDLAQSVRLDVELGGTPIWLTALSDGPDTVWIAVLESGAIEAVRLSGTEVTPVEHLDAGPWITTEGRLVRGGGEERPRAQFASGQVGPIATATRGGRQLVITPPRAAGGAAQRLSPLSHPIPIPETASVAWVGETGELYVWSVSNGLEEFEIDVPVDARIVTDGSGRIAVLSGATDRYAHGALGDNIEAAFVSIVSTFGTPRVIGRVGVAAGRVIEGIAPIWTDVNGDREPELIVTVTDGADGARINAYGPSGELVAEGPPIGRGYRWRHQIAVAPFGVERGGEQFVAVVRTPHIGGVIEFYRVSGTRFELVEEIPHSGLSSHRYGSRNLDIALAGDFAPGAGAELLLPDSGFGSLTLLQRLPGGTKGVLQLPAGGTITTNIAAAVPRGTITVGVGREDGMLRLWIPQDR